MLPILIIILIRKRKVHCEGHNFIFLVDIPLPSSTMRILSPNPFTCQQTSKVSVKWTKYTFINELSLKR